MIMCLWLSQSNGRIEIVISVCFVVNPELITRFFVYGATLEWRPSWLSHCDVSMYSTSTGVCGPEIVDAVAVADRSCWVTGTEEWSKCRPTCDPFNCRDISASQLFLVSVSPCSTTDICENVFNSPNTSSVCRFCVFFWLFCNRFVNFINRLLFKDCY